MPSLVDLIGNRFGLLAVINRADNGKNGCTRWLCSCNCGNTKIVYGCNLNSGDTKSCGCLHKKIITTHRHSKTKIYKIWDAMVQRCINPNGLNYKNYGGRGILVCKRWRKFENFLEDMGERPDGYSIERIDNHRGYSKANCKWATSKTQARNKRNNHMIYHNGKTQCLSAWAEEIGINKNTLFMRLKRGWLVERALAA